MNIVLGHHEVHLRDYLYIFKKRRFVVILFFAIAMTVGVLFTLRESVLYEASSKIFIERENPNVMDFKEVMSFDSASSDYYQTQYLMIGSETLIAKLVEYENLKQDPFLIAMQEGRTRKILKEFFKDSSPQWLEKFLVDPTHEELFAKRMLRIAPVRNSRLVSVGVRHPDPVRAAELANSLVTLYIQKNLDSRFTIANQASEMIQAQLEDLKSRVTKAEAKLQQYKEDNELVTIPSMNQENEFLQEAKLELIKTQSEEAKLSQRYLPAHPKRIHIRSQIETLAKEIENEEKRILELSRIAVDYSQLERESQSARQIYEALLRRLEETSSEAKTQTSNINVVDRALPPTRPFKPRPILNLLIAFFVGISGGVFLAFFLEYFNASITLPDDIEKGTNLELLGVVPKGPRQKSGPFKGEVVFDISQPSPTAEAFRALRTALLFRLRHASGCRTIMVTSPNPEEGKTTVSLNLALAFQQNNLKVLLIDGDLRMMSLTKKVLNNREQKGLVDILEYGESSKDMILSEIPEMGFDFLAGGSQSQRPTEILDSDEMKKFMEGIKKQYDVILIDSSPYLAVADVIVQSEYVDGIVIVARYHKTDKRAIKKVKNRFGNSDYKVLGVVLNNVDVRGKNHYFHQYYYYGYGNKR